MKSWSIRWLTCFLFPNTCCKHSQFQFQLNLSYIRSKISSSNICSNTSSSRSNGLRTWIRCSYVIKNHGQLNKFYDTPLIKSHQLLQPNGNPCATIKGIQVFLDLKVILVVFWRSIFLGSTRHILHSLVS